MSVGLDAYVFDAVRTPRGAAKETGALHAVRPIELLAGLFRALGARAPLPPDAIDDVVLGCSVQTGDQGANLAKIAALYAGLPESVSGVTLNRFCASGLDAIAYAALKVSSGMEGLVIAGGVESCSRVSLFADGGPWFADPEVARATRFAHMGVAADLVATLHGIDREACDRYALESHRRAAHARREGHFARSLVPVRDASGATLLDRDEVIRETLTLEKLAALPPAFAEPGAAAMPVVRAAYPELGRIEPVHHVGSAPAMADGASLLLIGRREIGAQHGLRPRARVRAFANASVEPVQMLTGTIPATRKALRAAGLALRDVDLFEHNESFAASVLAYQRALEIDGERLNVDGGAISMGHPLGATGGMLVATMIDALERRGLGIGVVTIPAGAGIGAALVIERV